MKKKQKTTSWILIIITLALATTNIMLDNSSKKSITNRVELNIEDKKSNIESNETINLEEEKTEETIEVENSNIESKVSASNVNSTTISNVTSNKSNIVSNKSNTAKSNIVSNKSNTVKSNSTSTKSNTVKSNNNKSNTVKSNSTSNKSNITSNNSYTLKTETSTKKEDYKYGIKIVHTYKDTYYVYLDGTKKLKESVEDKSKTKYDRSGYNATSADLLTEAKENMAANKNKVLEEIKYVNEYRKEAGLNPLEYDESLVLHANVKVLDMYYGDYFSHDSRDGKRFGYLGKELGINVWGENIAYGYGTAKAVTIGWYNSPGHRANMLTSDYTKIGVSYKNGYWVQNFR